MSELWKLYVIVGNSERLKVKTKTGKVRLKSCELLSLLPLVENSESGG